MVCMCTAAAYVYVYSMYIYLIVHIPARPASSFTCFLHDVAMFAFGIIK